MRLSMLILAACSFTIAVCFVTPFFVPSPVASIPNEPTCMIQASPFFYPNLCPLEEEQSNMIDYIRQVNQLSDSHPTAWFSKVPRFQFTKFVHRPTTWFSKLATFPKTSRVVLQDTKHLVYHKKHAMTRASTIFPARTVQMSRIVRQPMIRSACGSPWFCTHDVMVRKPLPLHPAIMQLQSSHSWFSFDFAAPANYYVNAVSAAASVLSFHGQAEKIQNALQCVVRKMHDVVTHYSSFAASFGKTMVWPYFCNYVDLIKTTLHNHASSFLNPDVVDDISSANISAAAPTNTTPMSDFTSLKTESLPSSSVLVVDDIEPSLLHMTSGPLADVALWNRTLFSSSGLTLAQVQAKQVYLRIQKTLDGIKNLLAHSKLYNVSWTSRMATAFSRLQKHFRKPGIATKTASDRTSSVKSFVVIVESPAAAIIRAAAPTNTTPISNFTGLKTADVVVDGGVLVPVSRLFLRPPMQMYSTTSVPDPVMDTGSRNRTLSSFDLATAYAQVQAQPGLTLVKNIFGRIQHFLEKTKGFDLSWTFQPPTSRITTALGKLQEFFFRSECKSGVVTNRKSLQESFDFIFDSSAASISAAAPSNTTPISNTTFASFLSSYSVGDESVTTPRPLAFLYPSTLLTTASTWDHRWMWDHGIARLVAAVSSL